MSAAAQRSAAEEVAAAARALARAGLVRAFGHVSRRVSGGFLITCTRPFATQTAGDVVRCDADGTVLDGTDAPIERPLHAAVYAGRRDVGAICRGHPSALVAWGTGTADVPLRHGLGLVAGHRIRVHDDRDLIADARAAAAAAATLGDDLVVLLRGNGALAVGEDTTTAAVRLWYAEERAAVALAGTRTGGAWDEDLMAARARHVPAELARARAWFTSTYGDD